jgi:small multidrug resistance pump
MSAVFLAAAILLEITATTALKLSDGLTRPGPVCVVVAG